MAFQKDFDEILAGLLTDCRNRFPDADLSQGSVLLQVLAATASAIWGAYRHQEWVARQIFPSTSDRAALELHAETLGLTPVAGESHAGLLARVLEHIRTPPAGGNKFDYPRWCREVDGVADAWLYYPDGQAAGSIYLVVTADEAATGSIIPNAALLDAVWLHVDNMRPVTARNIYIVPPALLATDVTLVGSGSEWDPEQAAVDIADYMQTLTPGQPLYLAQIYTLAVQNGAQDVIISAPAQNLTPQLTELIRPGVIDVS